MPGVFINPIKLLSQSLFVVISTARYSSYSVFYFSFFIFFFLFSPFPLPSCFPYLFIYFFAEETQGMAQPGRLSLTELYFHLLFGGEERRGRQFEIVSHYVAQGGLELKILDPPVIAS